MPAADTLSVPVIRLFDQRDIEFLRAVPGYTTRAETAFRRRRCHIFRTWLRSLQAEFLAARSQLQTWRVESPDVYQPVAPIALRCRMRFACAIVPAYLCLFQYRWKLGRADLAPVVRRFQAIRDEIRHCTLALS
jgi:hypothetical protein